MKSSWRNAWMLAFVPFALAACETPDTAEDAETATEEAPPAVAPAPVEEPATHMAQVMALNESGTTGQIELRAVGEGSEILVMLTGATEGVHQGMVHAGTCEAPGDVVAQLQPVTVDATGNGEATSEVSVALSAVMNGSHVVIYHEAGGQPGAPVACATIPPQQM